MRSFTRNPGARRILRQCTSSPVCAAPPARTARPALAQPQHRLFHAASLRLKKQQAPPAERPPADLNDLNVLGNTPAPSTSVDVCTYDGFGLNSGITFTGGTGALLVNGEAFAWRPWEAKGSMELLNSKGQVDIPAEAFAMFGLLWPRPDLLVIGVGKQNMPLSPATRKSISELGLRVEVLDTRNAAAQFNLLATERGVADVAAALIPLGWQEGVGAQ